MNFLLANAMVSRQLAKNLRFCDVRFVSVQTSLKSSRAMSGKIYIAPLLHLNDNPLGDAVISFN